MAVMQAESEAALVFIVSHLSTKNCIRLSRTSGTPADFAAIRIAWTVGCERGRFEGTRDMRLLNSVVSDLGVSGHHIQFAVILISMKHCAAATAAAPPCIR